MGVVGKGGKDAYVSPSFFFLISESRSVCKGMLGGCFRDAQVKMRRRGDCGNGGECMEATGSGVKGPSVF